MANIITGIRIVCAVVIVFCPTFSKVFYELYILGGISDMLDGIVARHCGNETKFGADFDTISDIIFAAIVIIKVVKTMHIQLWMIIWISCIAVIKCINIVSGFVIYKRFVSEHTVMNKVCGLLLFVIPFCIGSLTQKSNTVIITVLCIMATFSAIQEGHYIRIGKGIGKDSKCVQV